MNAKGKIIATDLDGTLFYPKHRFKMFSPENKKFIRRFIDEGGRVIIVSGRNRYFGQKVVQRLGRNIDVVGCNGAFVLVNGEVVHEEPIANEGLNELINKIKTKHRPAGVFVMSKEHNMILPTKGFYLPYRLGYRFYEIGQGTYREPSKKSSKLLHEALMSGTVYKIMLFFGVTKKAINRAYEAVKLLKEEYPDYEFSWCGELIEINKKGCTKANGLKHYLDYLKIKHDNIMVVGDSGNDISMFKSFPNSFCMSHADKSVREHAKYIIDSVHELEKYL